MFKGLLKDAKLIADRDPAAKSTLEVVLLYPGFHALFFHRFSSWFYRRRLFFIARFISQFARFITGIEIHPGAKLGRGLFIDHGMGVVVGETAEIGDNCTIYHGVTLGGTGKTKGEKRHPTIGNNVLIGAGAKILGPFHVGDNALIGANTFVSTEVESNTTVVGTKGRAVKRNGSKISSIELDQIHIPDPVAQELCRLLQRVEYLESRLATLEGKPVDDKKQGVNCELL